ncbi:5794_t:CDS:2, partial [Gigaspora rosea]
NPHILKLGATSIIHTLIPKIIRMGRSFIVSGFVSRITSYFVIFEVMDIDFMISNVNVVQNAQPSITSNVSEHRSDIDIIAENTDSNILQAVKGPQVTREGALENTQKTVKERVENPYINSSQERAIQETVVVDQDINMESETTSSGSEEAQSNLHIEEAVISGNAEPSDTLTKSSKERNITPVSPVHLNFQVTNVYAHPNISNRRKFLEAWVPRRNTNTINIIASDFNTNLNPTNNRISQAQNHYDATRNKLAELMENFTDTACVSKTNPFITYYQTVRNGHSIATRLDYIFLDDDHIWMCKKSETKFGNSDYLLV